MADSKKRKERSGGGGERGGKRSKGGSGGKWQTPHHLAKVAAHGTGKIEPGDAGIWATCARNQERRASTELKAMLEECAERFYGLKSQPDEQEDEDEDIEATIQKEIASMGEKQAGRPKLFTQIHLDLQCVLFFKTESIIDPVDFVHRICEEIIATPKIRRMRYINRLTPMTMFGKATEKGISEISKSVLGKYFELNESKDDDQIGENGKGHLQQESPKTQTNYSYAIRPTIRNHTTLKRDVVIKQIASSIANKHKVDLTKADKVIVVEIYQTVCGMSVVGDDWEAMKRFNLAELYSHDETSKAEPAIPTDVETKT